MLRTLLGGALRPSLRVHRRRVSPCCSAGFVAPPARPEYAELLDAATTVCLKSAALCLAVRSTFEAAVVKADSTPVTEADLACQALVSLELEKFKIPLVAEEDGSALRADAELLNAVARRVGCFTGAQPSASAVLRAVERGAASLGSVTSTPPTRFWVLDPIDGTKAFVRGDESQYAVGLALMDHGQPVLGVLALPNWMLWPASATQRGAILVASSGGGAWAKTLHAAGSDPWLTCVCNTAADTFPASVVTFSDHEGAWDALPLAKAMAPSFPKSFLKLCCGSLSKYAAIATGCSDVFVQHRHGSGRSLKSWDHAAGVAVLREAGGAVLDFSGRDLDLGRGRTFVPEGMGVLACAGSMRPAAERLVPTLPSGRPPTSPKLILLDRDGVINADKGTWIVRPEDVALLPGAAEAVASLSGCGFTCAVVTNQSCIGRGLLSWGGLEAVHASLRSLLAAQGAAVDSIFVASDDPTAVDAQPSGRRKPLPGLLLDASACDCGTRNAYLICS